MTSLGEELRGCLEAAGARLEAELAREEGFRALQQLEARAAEGRPVEVISAAELEASLIRALSEPRLYLARARLAEVVAVLGAIDPEPLIRAHVAGRWGEASPAPQAASASAAAAPGAEPAAGADSTAAAGAGGGPAAAGPSPAEPAPAAKAPTEADSQTSIAVAAAFLMASREAGAPPPAGAVPPAPDGGPAPLAAAAAAGPEAAGIARLSEAGVGAVLEAAVLASIAKLKSDTARVQASPAEPASLPDPAATPDRSPGESATAIDGAIANVVAATEAAARNIRAAERPAPGGTAGTPAAPAGRDMLLPPGSPIAPPEPAHVNGNRATAGSFEAPRTISEAELEMAEVRIVPRPRQSLEAAPAAPVRAAASRPPAPASPGPPPRFEPPGLAEVLPDADLEATIEIRRPGQPAAASAEGPPAGEAGAGAGKLDRFMRTLTGAKT